MGILSQRVERSEIKAGDHIYTWRAVFTYSHHGIYVGGSKVVHFTRKKDSEPSNLNPDPLPSSCPTFPDCGFQRPDSGVILTCLDCFLNKGSLYQFEYGVHPSVFLAKLRGGTCTIAQADPHETVVHRAMYLLQNGFGNYDVFENNCEDFAIYCKTGLLPLDDDQGIGRSGQASAVVGMPLAALLSTPFKLLVGGPVGMATVTAGMYCAGRYITDVGVRKDVMKVEVEHLAAHLGWRESGGERDLIDLGEDEEAVESKVVVLEDEEQLDEEEENRRKKRRII
ncbi:NC domain-containing protein [Rhynchospora pubera]|uniref:NC domain-containing protein n=1 Tax=Rhynchospora pubera TaxID=906938 RepID=A0AAV8E3I9_9POAL|nr:NC domain-containing protein [Rhynchospora pubera]